MDTIIERVLVLRIFNFVELLVMIIAMLLFIRWGLKGTERFKLIFAISIAISVVVVSVLGISLSRIVLDIQNEDYITYCGEYIDRGVGQGHLRTVVVYDDHGNEIKLFSTGSVGKGTYEGTVVYGKRSRIVVEYSGTPKLD